MRNENDQTGKASSFGELFGLTSVVFLLFAAPWFYGLTRFRDQLAAELLIFALFLIFFLFEGFRHRPSSTIRLGRAFDRWVLGTLGLGFIFVVFSSLPYRSLLTFVQLLSIAAFYFLVRWTVTTKRELRFLLWAMVALGTAYAAYGLFQFYGFISHDYWRSPTGLASRYVNGGHFAAFLLFSLFPGISLAASEEKLGPRVIAGLCLAIQGWAFLLTRSRTSWFAFLIGTAVVTFLMYQKGYLTGKTMLGLAVLSGGALWALGSVGLLGLLSHRIESLWETDFFSLRHRWKWWEASWEAFLARPWGWGLGAYRFILPRFRIHADRFLIDYAHNEFVQVAVDLGIAGLLFLTAFMKGFFGKLIRVIQRQEAGRWHQRIGIGTLGLGIALLLAVQVDFPLRIYANGIVFAAYLGLTACLMDCSRGPRGKTLSGIGSSQPWRLGPLLGRAACVVLILAAGTLAGQQLLAQVHFEKGVRLEKDFEWDKAETEYQKSVKWAPFYADYHKALGGLFRKRATVSMRSGQKEQYRQQAIESFHRSIQVQPRGSGWNHFVLASLYGEMNKEELAVSHFEKAVAEEPTNALFVWEYGNFSLERGDLPTALQLFERLQQIPFRENIDDDPCKILRRFSPRVQRYEDLKRVVGKKLWDHLCLGYVLGEGGNWEKADLEFNTAILKAKAVYNSREFIREVGLPIAQFYLKNKRFPQARALYNEFASLEPDQIQHREALKEISLHFSSQA